MGGSEPDRTPIYLFPVDRAVYFAHFFDRTDIFERLAPYYDEDVYRFEVPEDELAEVRTVLEDHWFDPVVVDDIAEFCVVKEQYTPHAEILKQSVQHWDRRGYNFFVMKNPVAVDQAVERGATRIGQTDLVLGI